MNRPVAELPNTFDLEVTLSSIARRAIKDSLGVDADPVVRPSKFADFQINAALSLAREIKKNPREVATTIAEELRSSETLERVDVAGPGFINATFTDEYLSATLKQQSRQLFVIQTEPKRIVIDYGSPNVAKEMHVGHLRSTFIGDALVRILTKLGHIVIRQNHLGDWGTQFGMLTEFIFEEGGASGELNLSDLDEFYRRARARFDSDEDFKQRSRKRVVALQSGDAETVRLWQLLMDESKRHFDEVFQRLGVLLDENDYRGESLYNDMLDGVVEALGKANLLVESQGAQCVFPEDFTNQDGDPLPMIIRKSDGGYGYQITDLASLRYNVDQDNADVILYVVDLRQTQHFAMVAAVSRMAGWVREDISVVHVAFGIVLGKDGRPFKSRAGTSVKLADLIDESVQSARDVLAERNLGEDIDVEKIANVIGIGALKWADLKNERTQNYVFDLKTMTSFDGNTAPYVQYATTRARSVLRKANINIENVNYKFVLSEKPERELCLHLNSYGGVIKRAAELYEPHHLCTYLFELATLFSSFYERCPVLSAPSQELRESRLAFCALTARVLEDGLNLLGIETLERM